MLEERGIRRGGGEEHCHGPSRAHQDPGLHLGACPANDGSHLFICRQSFGDDSTRNGYAEASQSKSEARGIRTPNLLNWSQTRCRCAIALCAFLRVVCSYKNKCMHGYFPNHPQRCRNVPSQQHMQEGPLSLPLSLSLSLSQSAQNTLHANKKHEVPPRPPMPRVYNAQQTVPAQKESGLEK